ncbi:MULTISPECIES: ASKHA domain-containing protein [Desulfitobacterium]|uniref:Putative metal-binding protein n=1 Tax=Desulfitobacterium dehalogenans (strain ATCC 51507 / DSM 9161 / JW/IU-DC1) TaxID=756499 RepID=I4ACD0_DESDJ|nr:MULTISPECIES: ASKHA domain-containing protein [Desulfitobacterium]AFM01615.1 putative metal-binding protein [Desulfitobacterium dehalogenans ATCC 51507]
MKNLRIIFQPGAISVPVTAGTTIMEAMNQSGLGEDFPCGGRGKCGKCRVKVIEGLEDFTAIDKDRLTSQELDEGIRLACITKINRDMMVEIQSPKQLQHNILSHSADKQFHIHPHLSKVFSEIAQPSLSEHKSDWQRLKESLAGHGCSVQDLQAPLPLLRQLPERIRESDNRVTSVVYGSQLLGIEPGDTGLTMLGMAFDIGTTTIVGYLMDLNSGKELEVVSTLNPQAQYGGDVISRITFAGKEEKGLDALHKAVTEAMNRLIGEAADKVGAGRNQIYGVSVAANTTIHHLFLGINPRTIGMSPYVSAINQGLVVDPADLGLEINGAGRVFVLPNIAGFVGADTTAVLLATELEKSDHVTLVLDIGTNGEIVLGSKNRMVACSAAAGPAFEGAQITNGMRGADGAIDHISFGDGLEYTVIGNGRPIGICGSALLDGVAGFVELGMINKRGKFLEPEKLTDPRALKLMDRLVKYEGALAFQLVEAGQTRHGRPIMITQNDIRELQLAKGAIAAGVRILQEAMGIECNDIQEVLLAGAFGNYLNPHSACVIGLIPRELENRIKTIGNAAGNGAKIALLSAQEFSRAEDLAGAVSFVELGSYPGFNTIFAENTYFKLD